MHRTLISFWHIAARSEYGVWGAAWRWSEASLLADGATRSACGLSQAHNAHSRSCDIM